MLAFDTNILFYAVNADSPFHDKARTFMDSVSESPNVVISELVLAELYCLLRNPVVNRRPLGPKAAVDVIAAWRNHPSWRLLGLPPDSRALHDELWHKAGESGFAYRRIYDARLALSLRAQGVTDFATVNAKDFAGMGFRRVFDPLLP